MPTNDRPRKNDPMDRLHDDPESGSEPGSSEVPQKPAGKTDFGSFVSAAARSSPDLFKTRGLSSASQPQRRSISEGTPLRSSPGNDRDPPPPSRRPPSERPRRYWRDSVASSASSRITGDPKSGESSSSGERFFAPTRASLRQRGEGGRRFFSACWPGGWSSSRNLVGILIGTVLFLPLIVYVVNQGGDEENDDPTPEPTTGSVIGMSDPSSGTEVTTTRTPEPTAAPTEERRRGGDNQRDLNGDVEGAQTPAGNSDAANSDIASNELGYIPVLEYHAFTNDPAAEEQFTRLFDDFFVDLQWLYDHDFYVIPLTDFVRNDIEAPAGKHPVILTFDDSTSSQFLFIRDDNGELVPDPNSAVGMMEAFFAAHPDFGRGGFFAVLPFNCFSIPNHEDQAELCGQKLAWLIDHGYEVGNHTMGHTSLGDISDETFKSEIAGAFQWLDDHAPGHHGQMLVIPFGRYPDRDLHPEQRDMLENGFQYDGEDYRIEAAFMVGADPSPSPSSTLWDPTYIPRIQAFDEELARWLPRMESGEVVLYTSDGNPDTISVPDSLPPLLEGELDPDVIAANGKTLIRYDPDSASGGATRSTLRDAGLSRQTDEVLRVPFITLRHGADG